MQDKLHVILAYAGIGIAMALWPSLLAANTGMTAGAPLSTPKRPDIAAWRAAAALLIAVFCIARITAEPLVSPLILTFGLLALVTSISGRRLDVVAMPAVLLALCVSATLLWWLRQGQSLDLSWYQLGIFSLVIFALTRLFSGRVPAAADRFPVKWLLGFALVAALLTFSTGIFFDDEYAYLMLWHHWGAFIGPSELLLSGAAIFHDFPAQYGLGPTAVIAGFCGKDCWHGMYFVAGFATFANTVLLAALALTLSRNRWLERLAFLALSLAASFLWAAYPPHLTSPMMTPSVSGLRFLPATLLLTYLFLSRSIEHSKRKIAVAQVLWAFGVLWSPESAFYVTLMWWPYYLFVQRVQGDAFARVMGLVRSGLRLLVVAAVLAIAFDGTYWLVYREQPTLYGIFAYALNPPGPLPINWHGAVWYFLLVTAIGLGTSLQTWRRSGDTLVFRRGFLLQLASYGAFSYFLGRSHDNNLLNVMPFFLLVLLQAISAAEGLILPKLSAVLAAALIAWLPTFGWQAMGDEVIQGGILTFDPKITDNFFPERPSAGLSIGALRAVVYIARHYGEPITFLDTSLDLIHSSPPAPWSALNAPEDFQFIPSAERREFLRRTAASLRRPGWVIVDHRISATEWLMDYDVAYRRTAELEFGRYYAIRYSPKVQ